MSPGLPWLASSGAEPQIALFLIVLIATVVGLVFQARANEKRLKIWAEVAARLGLQVYGKDHLGGVLDGSDVEVSRVTRGSGKNKRTYTRIAASGSLPTNLSLGREGFFSSFSEDVRSGDAEFDAAVRVKGDEGLCLALLDERMRSIVRAAVQDGWSFANGTWALETQRHPKEELEPLLKNAAIMAEATRQASTSIGERLLARVRDDVDAGARRRSLAHLIERYRDTPSYRRALSIASGDAETDIRLVAARELGDAEVLAGIALDPNVPGGVRAEALDALVVTRDATRCKDVLDRVIDELAEGPPLVLTRALARALGRVEHPRGEAALIALLDSKDEPLVLAAVRSLGQVGTVGAVPHLAPLRDRLFAFAIASASAAKDAILSIQARAGDAGAGSLTLAEDHGGGLSEVEANEVEANEVEANEVESSAARSAVTRAEPQPSDS